MKRVLVLGLLIMLAGCGGLRFGPGEVQKQNAYLHHRTVQTAAVQAAVEEVSLPLQDLTRQAAKQSEAIVAYYGLPQEIPESEDVVEILSERNGALTEQARVAALERPDPWEVADHFMELGLALAGILGGVYGSRVSRALQAARQKSQALKEVIQGNQLFKKEHPKVAVAFKKAQQMQSEATRRVVAELK
ncbi:MAG: hypothetical protein GY869_16840 [Planctomycetes bacterium]|nr:hypothetical protein [Planctomycetota bacterium]